MNNTGCCQLDDTQNRGGSITEVPHGPGKASTTEDLRQQPWECCAAMAGPGPFNKEQFLLRALAALFLAQLLLHLLTLGSCLRGANQKSLCSDLSRAVKDTFEDALATTLALLSASTFNRGNRGPDS